MEQQKLTLPVEAAGELLGISRSLAYQMARTGGLPTLRFGKRIVVPRKAIERMLECSPPEVTALKRYQAGTVDPRPAPLPGASSPIPGRQ